MHTYVYMLKITPTNKTLMIKGISFVKKIKKAR